MDTLPSSTFRKRYAHLRSPVAVTVNGHIIGRWMPGAAEYVVIDGEALSGDEQRLRLAARPVQQITIPRPMTDEDVVDGGWGTSEQQTAAAERLARDEPEITVVEHYPLFNTRPFTPVPKVSGKPRRS